MSAESEALFIAALERYRMALAQDGAADPAGLVAAAEGHVGASRSHDEVVAEYADVNAGSNADPGHVERLSQELNGVRMAQAIVDGNLPYRPPVVTTGN